MIQDLHSHTYYSFCGKDAPEVVIENAIENGIELLGITDHNYGIALQWPDTMASDKERRRKDYQRCLDAYLSHMKLLAEKYKDQIRIVVGVEINTRNHDDLCLPKGLCLSGFDYCLIEYIDHHETEVDDLFEYVDQLECPCVGLAHTDIPAYLEHTKQNSLDFFKKMADHNMFWEMNVNYDSLHRYREHEYVSRSLEDQRLIDTLKASNVKLSVGFDGHRIEDYSATRVIDCCKKVTSLGLNLIEF